MGWRVQGSNCSRDKRIFASPKCLDWLWDPPNLIFNRHQGPFLGTKWPGCEVNHSLPCCVEVKNGWSYTTTPTPCLHSMERDNFTNIIYYLQHAFFTRCMTDLYVTYQILQLHRIYIIE
jgi:hypothetical protein